MYVFFWVFPRRLIKIAVCRRFGTLYQFHLQRSHPAFEDGTDSVPKRRHTAILIRRRGNTQKNTYI